MSATAEDFAALGCAVEPSADDSGRWTLGSLSSKKRIGQYDDLDEALAAAKAWAGPALKPTGPMTRAEAEAITTEIRAWAGTLWAKLKEAHDRQAHKALGYDRWSDYCRDEFDISKSQAYRLIQRAELEADVLEVTGLAVSPMGDIPERLTRELDADEVVEAVRKALIGLEDENDTTKALAAQGALRAMIDAAKPPIVDEDGEVVSGGDTSPSSPDTQPDGEATAPSDDPGEPADPGDDPEVEGSAPEEGGGVAGALPVAPPVPDLNVCARCGDIIHRRNTEDAWIHGDPDDPEQDWWYVCLGYEDAAENNATPKDAAAPPPPGDAGSTPPDGSARPSGGNHRTAQPKVQMARQDVVRKLWDDAVTRMRALVDVDTDEFARLVHPDDRDHIARSLYQFSDWFTDAAEQIEKPALHSVPS